MAVVRRLTTCLIVVVSTTRESSPQAARCQVSAQDCRALDLSSRTFICTDIPLRPPLVVSRSPIASGLVPSLSVKFVGTRSRRSSSSASSPSNVLFVKLLRTSRHVSFPPCSSIAFLTRVSVLDGPPLPVLGCHGSPGSLRSIPRLPL